MREENENRTSGFSYFLAGLGFGAVLGILFAPGSGQETRDLLGAKTNFSKDYLSGKRTEVREQAEQVVGRARDLVSQQKEQLSAALEAGKQAYHSEKAKTQ